MPVSPAIGTGLSAPSAAFVGLAWLALGAGMLTFLIGLWRASMPLSEKGFFLTLFLFGLFAAVSLQKTIRDKAEGIRTTSQYLMMCWISVALVAGLLVAGLMNVNLLASEKGFYGMAFMLSLFAAVTVQKNVRDLAAISRSGY